MKALTEKVRIEADNAWGQSSVHWQQEFEVENTHERPHYLGWSHSGGRLRRVVAGDVIVVYTSPDWTCWSFKDPARSQKL